MDSIYHIETDIKCKVLHYGKEVCIALPGEDSSIELRKGRHKLTFISTENPVDHYSIMYVVPENDIEDCIEVELKSIRDKRLAEEAEAKRIAYEVEQKRILEERQKREEQERKQAEERKRQEEELQRKEQEELRKQRILPIAIALKDGKEYDNRYWGTWEADYSLFPKLFENGKIGFVDFNGNTLIQPKYEWRKQLGNSVYGFSEGLSCVIEQYVPVARRIDDSFCIDYIDKIGYIDSSGNPVLSGLFLPNTNRFFSYPYFSQDRIIVAQREQIDTRDLWVREGYKTENWNQFLMAPPPNTILDRRIYNKNGPKEELLVRFPVYRTEYVLIDKKGVIHNTIPKKEGYYNPVFYPFRQGLSIILWRAMPAENCSNLIEVIDREGNLVLSYKNLTCFRTYSSMPTVFLGDTAYLEVLPLGTYLKLSLDGRVAFSSPATRDVSDELQHAYNKLLFNR